MPLLSNRNVEEERRGKNYRTIWRPIKWTPTLWSEMINLYDLSFRHLPKNGREFGVLLLSQAKISLIQFYFWFLISRWLLWARFLRLPLRNLLNPEDVQSLHSVSKLVTTVEGAFEALKGRSHLRWPLTWASKSVRLCQEQEQLAEVSWGSQHQAVLKKELRGAWVAQSVERPPLTQVTISRSVGLSPAWGSLLSACSLLRILYLLLSLPLLHSLMLSLSKINKR